MRNKFWKGTTALLLALCMVFSMGIFASADETGTESKVNLNLGVTKAESTLTAQVTITENTADFRDMQIKLLFNSAQLEYKGIEAGDADLTLTTNKSPNALGALNVIATNDTGYTGTGVVYTATFAIKEGAPADATVAFDQDWCETDVDSVLTFTNEAPVEPQPGDGVTVSGTVTSYLDESEVTVELLNGETVAYTTTVTGKSAAYTFENVAPGTYTMKVSKVNHVTRTYEVVVADAAVTQDAEINPLGDVTGDGKVKSNDWNMMYKATNSIVTLEGYQFACADLNGDGKIKSNDWNRVYKHINGIQKLW